MKKSLFIFILLCVLLFVWCTQKESSPVGSSYLDENTFGLIAQKMLYPASSDTSFYTPVSTVSGKYLYIGQMKDMHAYSLLRFTGIEDSVEIDSAVIAFTVYRLINTSTLPAVIDVYAAASTWDDSSVTYEDVHSRLIGNHLGSITVSSDTTDSLFFRLDKDLVEIWMDSSKSDQNYGLYLDSNDDFMIQCYSRDISSSIGYGPVLMLYSSEDTLRYPKFIEASQDIFLPSTSNEIDSDRLIIESGTAYRTYIKFDLSIFEPTDIINRALLILSVDTTRTLPDIGDSFALTVCNPDSLVDLESLECESDYVSAGSVIDTEGTVDLTYQIQGITAGQLKDTGFLIKNQSETSEFSRISFFSTTADSTIRPRLEIIYTKSSINQL